MYGKRMKDAMGRETGEMAAVEFDAPEGLKLDGESGEAMVTWTMTPEGKLRLTSIEGVSIGGEMESPEKEEMVFAEMPDDEDEEEA